MILGGVIYIGDRNAGKTTLAWELTNSNSKHVEVTSALLGYDILKQRLYNAEKRKTRPTDETTSVNREPLEVKVTLTRGQKTISSAWLDTPGEIWRSDWQSKYPQQWQLFLDAIQETKGILLILPPYREIIDPNKDDPNKYITRQQWTNRFNKRIQFFRYDCPKIRHLLLCLNKVDLCLGNYEDEAKELAYDLDPRNQKMNWQQKHEYVLYRYFAPFHDQIEQLNRSIDGLFVRCFITTIKNRDLLELPWIYLGSHLGK